MNYVQLKKKWFGGFPYRRPANAFGEFVRMQTMNCKQRSNFKKISKNWKNCDEDVKSLCREMASERMKTYKYPSIAHDPLTNILCK